MNKMLRSLLTMVLTGALMVGCSSAPSVVIGNSEQTSGVALETGPVGTPWKDWFVYGVLTERDQIRPQDDFFAAVNKDWILAHADEGYGWSPVTEREEQIQDQMIGLLEGEAPQDEQYGQDLGNLKAFYELAGDWEGRDRDGVKPVRGIVNRLRAIDSLDQMTAWLCSDDYRLSQCWEMSADGGWVGVGLFGLSPYLQEKGFWTQEDGELPQDLPSEGYVLEIDSPSLALAPYLSEEDPQQDEETLDAFRTASDDSEIAYNMLLHVGFDEDTATDVLVNAIALESLVLDGYNPEGDAEDVEWFTYNELAHRDGFPLAQIIEAYGYGDAGAFMVYDPQWLETMDELYVPENLDLFVSHALVGVLLDSAQMLDSQAYDIVAEAGSWADWALESDEDAWDEGSATEDDAGSEESGASEEGNAWSQEDTEQYFKRDVCSLTAGALPVSYAKVYTEHFYDEGTTQRVTQMVQAIVGEYERMLQEEDWLSQQTRDAAVKKLRAMTVKVGHPEVWQDTSQIKVGLRSEGSTLFGEVRNLRSIRLQERLASLRNSSADALWTDCMDVNAYYLTETNSITIGAGYLGGAFWSEDASYENLLASTGVTIGHEVSHAFDDYGANFDEVGAYRNWWTDEDYAKFEKRVARVRDALERIDPLGLGTYDGKQTCGECIADLGGMKVTMRLAAQQPSFDYDTFFRSYAKSWACLMTFDEASNLMDTDTHPLDRDRVNIPVREYDEFLETYGVKRGDGMWLDSKDRISVW